MYRPRPQVRGDGLTAGWGNGSAVLFVTSLNTLPMYRPLLLFTVLLLIAFGELTAQVCENANFFGLGLANVHDGYAEGRPGLSLVAGLEHRWPLLNGRYSGYATVVYQYDRFRRTRSSSTARLNGTETYTHRSHRADLHQVLGGIGMDRDLGRFRVGGFLEGGFLLYARYAGWAGTRINGGPEEVSDEFNIALLRAGENETGRYRIFPGAERLIFNAGGACSYRLNAGWRLGLRYSHTINYLPTGIEFAAHCADPDSCPRFRQRGEDLGGNQRGSVQLVMIRALR